MLPANPFKLTSTSTSTSTSMAKIDNGTCSRVAPQQCSAPAPLVCDNTTWQQGIDYSSNLLLILVVPWRWPRSGYPARNYNSWYNIAGPSGGGWREVVGESLHVSLLLTVPHSTCLVYSLFIDQCVAVLPTCVGSVSVVVSFLHLWVAGGARRPRRRTPRLRAPA